MKRVLIVDDNEANLYLLRAMLQGHGYAVVEARNGAAALESARKAPPDLAVSDLLMPVMDGYSLLRQWRADASLKAIPFIVYTATYTDPRDERLALSLGADAFILKPAEPADFMAKVAEVMANAERGALPPAAEPPGDKSVLYEAQTEVLIRKLEQKAHQLGQTNRDLLAEIADRRVAEEKLRLVEDQYRQSQKLEAMGRLAAGVAHDFNNIIAVIQGYAELALVKQKAGESPEESLCEIVVASERARGLVRQILTFSRQNPQKREVMDLAPTIRETVRLMRAIIPAEIDITIAGDASAPAVLADPTQIHQVVSNLCTNAWHACDGRPGRIRITLDPMNLDPAAAAKLSGMAPGRVARLTVSDTGKGMDAATVERIFDPFFTTKPQGTGTGLGLSVVQGIVQGHDGAITVESRPGSGTVFQVFLPAATHVPSVAPVPVPATNGGQRILYLDDEKPLLFLATLTLEGLGYRVSSFSKSEDAIKAVRDNPGRFDLVFADLNMPGLSGLEVAAEIHKTAPDLPIMLCSGHVNEGMRRMAKAAGVSEVVHKPGTVEEFADSIPRLIAGALRTV